MGKCIVNGCRNRTGVGNKPMSFFRLPKNVKIRLKWVEAINKNDDWIPTPHFRICCNHFKLDDIYITEKGYKKLKPHAIPSLKLNTDIPDAEIESDDENQLKIVESFSLENNSSKPSTSKEINSSITEEDFFKISKQDISKKRKLQMKLNRLSVVNEKQRKIINKLKQRIIRMKKKVTDFANILECLEDKKVISVTYLKNVVNELLVTKI